MAHFSRLDENNNVIAVHVVNNSDLQDLPFPESESVGIAYLTGIHNHLFWKQTSYNGTFRKNYAGVGYTYDPVRDAFIGPQPFPSWVLNETTCQWQAPVPRPGEGYVWDESTLQWVLR